MKVRLWCMLTALCLLLAAFGAGQAVLGESYSASAMRLLRYEGEVTIEDAKGNSRFVLPNVRFSSGEAMKTGENSSASVSLDASKIVTLDAQSRVEFAQSGSHMELTLTEGTLFLDVSEKLDANETLDIKTSTMTVGIRGTIVFVSTLPSDKAQALYGVSAQPQQAADGSVTVFGVLEGSAQISDENGDKAQVDAGQIAVVGKSTALAEMSPENVTPFIQQQFENDETLSRVVTACPQLFEDYDFPADGDWEFTGEVLIIAQSASKLYDGTPLTRTGDILVYNLPEMFNISANAVGAITNAGTAQNPIGSYAIFNQAGENVTDHFNALKTIPGQLVVDPAPMTIWTGSAEKYYDGTPLTNEEAGFDVISGGYKEEPWRDTSLVLSEESGETLYGLSGQLLVHGTNPLTGQTSQIVLRAGEKLTVQLNSEGDWGSIHYNIEKVSEQEIPKEILRLYADNRALLEQACADTGWDIDLISERISQLEQSAEPTTVKDGLTISVNYAGGLMRQLTNARINVDSDITDYSGRALNGEEARFTEIRIDDSVVVTATGSQTEVGQSENGYQIDWGSENPANFVVSEDLGTLTVKQAQPSVVLTAYSASKTYDGAPLTSERVSARGLPEGYKFSAKVTGSQTDAGSGKSVIYQYTITDPEGRDVTGEFSNVTLVSGTLTVNPAPLTVKTASASKQYDGAPLTASENAQLLGLVSSDSASVTATGSLIEVGSCENTYTIEWGSAKSENYQITEELGTLTVSKNSTKITVTSASAEAVYTPFGLINHDYATDGLPEGFSLEATVEGVQMLAGSSENTISDYAIKNSSGEDKTENFTNVELVSGTLTVTKAKIDVWSHVRGSIFETEASYVYRGSGYPFSCAWTGAYNADSPATAVIISDMYGGGWTEKDVGTYTLSFTVSLREDLNDRYEIGDVQFGSITITPAPLTIKTGSASKGYDGKPLTAGASLEGLAGVDSWADYTLTATGSITDLGSTENSYTLDWGEIDASNYEVSEDIGTLSVTKNTSPVVVTAPSTSFVYNGKGVVLMSGASVTGLPEGISMMMTPTHPEIKDAGSYETGVSYYIIDDNLGKPVTDYFTNITVTPGTVTVEPLRLTIDLAGGETVYTGSPQGFNATGVSVTYANGENAGTQASGSSSAVVGSLTANYTLLTGDSITLTVEGSGIDVGSYTISAALSFTAGKASNYSVSYINTQLDILPLQISLDLGGRTVVFNGQNQTFDMSAVKGTILNGSRAGQSANAMLNYTVSGGAQYTLNVPGIGAQEVMVSGAGVNAGQYTVTVSGNSGGNVVYSAANNVLTVEPLKINVWAFGGVYGYGLEAYSAEVDVIYLSGPNAETVAECLSYNTNPDGSLNASFQLYTGNTITVSAPGAGPAIGTYTITPSYTLSGAASNYSVSVSGATIEIKLDPYSTDTP